MANYILIQLARKQQPNHPQLAACWNLVIRGLEIGWLDSNALNELLEHLLQGHDFIVEELGFEFVAGDLRVWLLDEIVSCSPNEMIEQLQKLKLEYKT